MFSIKGDVLRFFVFLTVLLLLLSFGLHMIEFHHHHPEAIYGVGLKAAMHQSDRKWFFVLLIILTSFIPFSYTKFLVETLFSEVSLLLQSVIVVLRNILYKVLDPLRDLLRRGILQPQFYG